MESQNNAGGIACPLHPSEVIQRANLDEYASKELYCLECILQADNHSLSTGLKTIPKVIETAADLYARSKASIRVGSNIPDEYLSLTSNQGERLEKLSKHIEDEKKKVGHFFDTLSQDVLKMITDKKNEYLHNLDQQLFNLRYWYIYFDKQLKKAFPSEEDIPFLYPSKEDLNNKLGKISNVTQLLAFVRNLKEDINEKKGPNGLESKDSFLQKLSQELKKVEKITPDYKQGDMSVSELKEELNLTLAKLLDQTFYLEDPIQDVLKGGNFGSSMITGADFELIKSWLPKGVSWNPKLLYKSSRDGKDGPSFHKLCDGKGNTITIVKAEFSNSKKPEIIGGFLDSKWNSSGIYIQSQKAFLFSVSSKVKCNVTSRQHAGYGNSQQGPTFGSGHDLVVSLAGSNQCYVNPSGYQNTAQLTSNKSGGQQFFTAVEVEVFQVSNEKKN